MSTVNQQLNKSSASAVLVSANRGSGVTDSSVRLAKRVAQIVPCSRADAERYIEGGWVQVNGVVIELPQHRVTVEKIIIDPNADTASAPLVTLLLHKPSGYDAISGPLPAIELLEPESQSETDRSKIKILQQHFSQLTSATPLENVATGLVVYTKDYSVQRRLIDDAHKVECETIVNVAGAISADVLRQLNRMQVINGQSIGLGKVSIGHQTAHQTAHQTEHQTEHQTAHQTAHQNTSVTITGLRFANKGFNPGQIKQVCDQFEIKILSIRRIRIGQVSLKDLPEGQWRYLTANEKF